ncbi:MAG: secretion protein HlyD [Acidobacteriaceae bacterium]|jgi:HlyD family secretion protein|nr:secretion protein HlyD [Acidobacteriaceae bacterium]
MKRKRLLWSGLAAVLVLLVVVGIVVARAQSGYSKVVTGKVVREDVLSQVSGTGQIKPKVYANVGAETIGRITHLFVKEGDHVKKGQVLATMEDVQPSADVATQQATIQSSKTDLQSSLAAEKTAEANLASAKASLEQKELDWKRGQALYEAQLIPKSDYDTRKAAYDVAVAAVAQSEAALAQSRAQTASSSGRIDQATSTLRRYKDVLNRTVAVAPFDGIVTNLPVREGETVVIGIQNAEGSTLMTIADMSVVTAEVKVDETDIVNLRYGQPADITVDALPGKTFRGHVTIVGDQAILRSTGIATSQSTTGTEEAKDFKVVVTLDNPSDDLRPGLSAAAKILTAEKKDVLSIPLQALTLRRPSETVDTGKSGKVVNAAASSKEQPIQGVFVLKHDGHKLKVAFVPITTGITGTTDIEVTGGLAAGDEIVTGPYKTLRELKSGAQVKPLDANAASTATSTT